MPTILEHEGHAGAVPSCLLSNNMNGGVRGWDMARGLINARRSPCPDGPNASSLLGTDIFRTGFPL